MKQRLVTGLIAGVFFLGVLILGGYLFTALIMGLAVIGFDEYMRMLKLKESRILYLLGLIGVIIIGVPWHQFGIEQILSWEKIIWMFMLLFLFTTVVTKNKVSLNQAGLVFIGIVYLGLGFHYIMETRLLDSNGLFWTSLVLIGIWSADSGAYFGGVLFGKHLLWPAISPKKTYEGAVGGIILAVIVSLIFSYFKPELLSIRDAIILGVVIAIIGQVGDFIQSAYKRTYGIKDTGALLPGHGGVLDRVDSWLIVFPFVHFLGLIPHL
ncbi:phosphatidate cytidylyltransferase [Paenibacillus psychroresistens]|uniref:Phosphatidate cytidylyltransferase n=1 Tax=Paenibacillus psychroresistens TaxID=1778678 RepID=A0A6B8RKI7_9BACL|nr:phosphatidate cytidylyltransferase [Paenibacillus psychroresistens]